MLAHRQIAIFQENGYTKIVTMSKNFFITFCRKIAKGLGVWNLSILYVYHNVFIYL